MITACFKKFFLLPAVAVICLIVSGANEYLKRITTEDLGGAKRYLLYASTDKPIYRCGESVFLRTVILNAADNTPLRDAYGAINVKIRGPKGSIVFNSNGQIKDSTSGMKWEIPKKQSGGCYTAIFSSRGLGTPETKRNFEIRAYRPPRLKSQIEFLRKGYGPGDTVQAAVNIKRAEGGIPVNAKVNVIARLDGVEIFRKNGLKIDSQGNCSTEFKLPDEIKNGDGTLAFVVEDGGIVETAAKTIPVLLQNMRILFYPEGGEMIAGLPCRIYLQAKRPDGKPADIEGRIYEFKDGKVTGKTIASLKTFHEGRGKFTFTPNKGTSYSLILDKPSGIKKVFALPEVKDCGAIIKATQNIYKYNGKISLTVQSTIDSEAATITICKREVELDSKPLIAGKVNSVKLDPKDSEGVLIATVWNQQGEPLAERLIYRKPKFKVNIKLKTEKGPFIPGGKVSLNVLTTDENNKPIEAVVCLTVTDDSVLEMIDKREQDPRLPAMVYLESEVKDLADAHVYLDSTNAKSPEALDLLLGTQGWRRFILVKYNIIKKSFPKAARRTLAEKRIVLPRIKRKRFKLFKAALNKRGIRPFPAVAPVDDKENKREAEEKPFVLMDMVAKECPLSAPVIAKKMLMARRKDCFSPWILVREYSHQTRPERKANDRIDFSETLYWNAGIRTGARDGKAAVSFDLSDSITSFRVMADAFGNNGALGESDILIKSIEPFYIEPKMPQEVTAGDIIELPVAMINSTEKTFEDANLIAKCNGLRITQSAKTTLNANSRIRRIIRISASRPGTYKLVLNASAGSFSDTVTKTLIVKPAGFPIKHQFGGLIDSKTPFKTSITIPEKVEIGSLQTSIKLYPTPLANMEEALNALLRRPNGCFEQTSSTTYPLIMAQQYFTSHQGISPEKIAKASKLLQQGYKKLTGFECKRKGYEWFGGDPGHEALTAYGLMEFMDMKKVMSVDQSMIDRTRTWLLSRRDGKGGFKRNKRALDSFGRAPVPVTNAYILWALLESGENPKSLTKEIEAVKQEAFKTKNSYVIALAANILYLSNDAESAAKLCTKLSKAVAADGHVSGAVTSITRSGGSSLKLETTALAILAWIKDDKHWANHVETSMKWLFEQCKSGRFGSTQSTILVLKAINAYDKARSKPKAPGSIQLFIDGEKFGKAVKFDQKTKGAINLADFSSKLTAGKHKIELKMNAGSKMPFSISVNFNTFLPASDSKCDLFIKTMLAKDQIKEGEPLEMTVQISVKSKDASMPVAIIGIPAGLKPRHDQLKELVKAGKIASYEIIGREVVLYWRGLKAGAKRIIPISLTAEVPGEYSAPASRTYLYYTDEYKSWVPGTKIKITSIKPSDIPVKK